MMPNIAPGLNELPEDDEVKPGYGVGVEVGVVSRITVPEERAAARVDRGWLRMVYNIERGIYE